MFSFCIFSFQYHICDEVFVWLAVLFQQFLSILYIYYSSNIRIVVCIVRIAVHYYFDICTLLENIWDRGIENNYYKPEENEQCENL